MKIISIKQPWASLIVSGQKDIENRDWRTHYRGPVLVHASQRPDDITPKEIWDRFGVRILPGHKHPAGGVIGMVDIVDCVEEHHSKWFVGQYGFVLKNARKLPFIRWSGQLGVREAPRELMQKLARAA